MNAKPSETSLAERKPWLVQRLEQADYAEIIAKSLPPHLSPTRFMQIAMNVVRGNMKLCKCTPVSFFGSLFESARLGLEPCTALGHCWIIPYGDEAQLQLGYKGYIALADRVSISMQAERVMARDTEAALDGINGDLFEFELGSSRFLRHRPAERSNRRVALRYVYAEARWADGRYLFEVTPREKVEESRNGSQGYRAELNRIRKAEEQGRHYTARNPWFAHPESMERKTGIRRLAPFVPGSPQFARALELDGQADRGERQAFEVPDGIVGAREEDEAARLREETERLEREAGEIIDPEGDYE